jgi:hypothetical protein
MGSTRPSHHVEVTTRGYKYRDLVLQTGGLDARLTTLLCKKIIVAKTRCNLAGSSEEGCGSKSAVMQ